MRVDLRPAWCIRGHDHDGHKDPAMSLISELKRRNVIRVAPLYLVAAWVILQVRQLLFDVLEAADWTSRLVLGLLMLGFRSR